MFTGLIREVGEVVSVDGGEAGVRLELAAPETAGGSRSATRSRSTASASRSSRSVTAGSPSTRSRRRWPAPRSRTLEPGSSVNLEPALRAGDPLGGHYVQGHVDGVGTRPLRRARGRRPPDLVRRRPAELLRYVVEKGSIAVQGTSLTVAARRRRRLRGRVDPAHARGDDARRARARRPASTSRWTCSRNTSRSCSRASLLHGRDHARSRRSRRRSRTSARAGWSSSSTTRTARTRAT